MKDNITTMTSILRPFSQWWSSTPTTTAILTTLGFLAAAKVTYNLGAFIALYLVPSKLSRYLHSSPTGKPPWALITGATDGIGRALAHELAGHGFNVVIHGRNPTKLAATEKELRAAHPGREFRALRVDAGLVGCASCLEGGETKALDFSSIVEELSDIHLTVLVSNAGGAPNPVYRTLDKVDPITIAGNVSLNALFPLHLLSQLIPTLVRNSPSLVMTIGSLSDYGLPLLSVYGPSKSFLMTLTNCVARDMRLEGRDVEVIGMRTGRVTGVTHLKEKATVWLPDARTLARAALGRVGCGRAEVVPYWGHAVLQRVMDALPEGVRERVFLRIMTRLREKERQEIGKRAE